MILRESSYIGWKVKKTIDDDSLILKTGKSVDNSLYIIQLSTALPVNFKSPMAAFFSLTVNDIIRPITEIFQSDYVDIQAKNLWGQFLDQELSRSFSQKIDSLQMDLTNQNNETAISFSEMEIIAYCSFEKSQQKNV